MPAETRNSLSSNVRSVPTLIGRHHQYARQLQRFLAGAGVTARSSAQIPQSSVHLAPALILKTPSAGSTDGAEQVGSNHDAYARRGWQALPSNGVGRVQGTHPFTGSLQVTC
jgi:hypothetical protein